MPPAALPRILDTISHLGMLLRSRRSLLLGGLLAVAVFAVVLTRALTVAEFSVPVSVPAGQDEATGLPDRRIEVTPDGRLRVVTGARTATFTRLPANVTLGSFDHLLESLGPQAQETALRAWDASNSELIDLLSEHDDWTVVDATSTWHDTPNLRNATKDLLELLVVRFAIARADDTTDRQFEAALALRTVAASIRSSRCGLATALLAGGLRQQAARLLIDVAPRMERDALDRLARRLETTPRPPAEGPFAFERDRLRTFLDDLLSSSLVRENGDTRVYSGIDPGEAQRLLDATCDRVEAVMLEMDRERRRSAHRELDAHLASVQQGLKQLRSAPGFPARQFAWRIVSRERAARDQSRYVHALVVQPLDLEVGAFVGRDDFVEAHDRLALLAVDLLQRPDRERRVERVGQVPPDRAELRIDPFTGAPLTVVDDGERIEIRSAGRDGRLDTDDDIRFTLPR